MQALLRLCLCLQMVVCAKSRKMCTQFPLSHQAQLGAPSKSGTLPSVRQPPPPPPPAEPRAGPTLRAGSMPRQASIGPPLKESATSAPRQQSRGPVQQQSRHPESIKFPRGSVAMIHTSDGLMHWPMLAPSAETNPHPQRSSKLAGCNVDACWEAGAVPCGLSFFLPFNGG